MVKNMARISINISEETYAKLKSFSEKNADSLSTTAKQMLELGLLVSSKQNEGNGKKRIVPIDEYCQKTTIESMMLLKNLLSEKLEFSQEKLDAIKGASRRKHAEVLGLIPD